MFIKRKHIAVVVFSSLVVVIVFASTLIGYTLYIQWKKDSFTGKYHVSIGRLTAELFRKNIVLSNVNVKEAPGDEHFPAVPLLEGTLKNSSGKTITSVLLEVSFLAPDGTVEYYGQFYPVGGKPPLLGVTLFEKKHEEDVLLSGQSLSFSHFLKNCPRRVIRQLSSGTNFARGSSKNTLKMVCSVVEVSVT
ncbi:MAG: hypothetical protein ABIH74_02665 [Candidatus Omnitrophota bacterium]